MKGCEYGVMSGTQKQLLESEDLEQACGRLHDSHFL